MTKKVGYVAKYERVKGKNKKIIDAHYFAKKNDSDSFKLSGLFIGDSFFPESEKNCQITRVG